jgi:hypothetical protein
MRVNCQLWAFFYSAIVATSLAAQTPEAESAPGILRATADKKNEQILKKSEPTQSTKQLAKKQQDVGPPLVKPMRADQPIDDSAPAKREAAQKALDDLRSMIQSQSRPEIETTGIMTQADELQTKLDEAKNDSDLLDEVMSRATALLKKTIREWPKSSTPVKPAPAPPGQKPSALQAPVSSGGDTPTLIIVSLIISIAALIAGPMLSYFVTRKALRSAGLR